MASIIKVDTIQDQDGNNIISEAANTITIGASGDTITIPSGATFASVGIDDNATSTAITIDDVDKVKIGTTADAWSGSNSLVIKEASGDGGITIVSASTTNNGNIGFSDTEGTSFSNMRGLITYLHNGDSMRFMTANTEAMRIDSSGKIGIGTSSPIRKFNVYDSADSIVGRIQSGQSSSWLQFAASGTGTASRIGSPDGASIASIALMTSDQERMRIDSSGNVGIGTSSPTQKLDVNGNLKAGNNVNFGLADANNTVVEVGIGATGNKFAITDYIGDTTYTGYGLRVGRNNTGANTDSIIIHRGTGALSLNAQDAGVIQFKTSNTERMRIDSSGNLLVGKTASNIATAGIEVDGNFNKIQITRSGGTPFFLNRLTSDGDIIDFRKDGTTLGSIGSRSGVAFYIGNPQTNYSGIDFAGPNPSILPRKSNSLNNGDVDLGGVNYRYKDLYLAGGLYVGGTGTANKLDDYEEGTWTPTTHSLSGFSGTITYSSATYVKIGKLVTINLKASASSSTGNLAQGDRIQINLASLPFSQVSSDYGATCGIYAFSLTDNATIAVTPHGTGLRFFVQDIYGTPTRNGGSMKLTITYETT